MTDQLQKLLDHQSITSLPHVYCDAVIRKDYESLANLFTEDGEFVVPAAALAVQAAFAATPVPQPPQPVPPIIQPYPGPIGPDGGPVDPTPTQPPPTAS